MQETVEFFSMKPKVFEIYKDYPHLQKEKKFILNELEKEESKFRKLLENGLRKFKKLSEGKKIISGKDAFLLFQSYGFPLEMTEELAAEHGLKVKEKEFQKEFTKHQQISRKSTKARFKSGLADTSKQTTLLHTATHLLHTALRKVLGQHVKQKGSNITTERLRFDFSYDKKLTQEQLLKVEQLVNKTIKKALPITRKEMSIAEARKQGALAFLTIKEK